MISIPNRKSHSFRPGLLLISILIIKDWVELNFTRMLLVCWELAGLRA